jgi:hypothetical protein
MSGSSMAHKYGHTHTFPANGQLTAARYAARMTSTQEDITTTRKEREHMDFHYDLNSASRLYREAAFGEARKRHLVKRARASRDPRGSKRSGLCGLCSWRSALALLRGVAFSE